MNQGAFLCIDAGTQSLRASLIDKTGLCLARAVRPMPDPVALQPGWAELDLNAYLALFQEAIREVSHAAKGLQVQIDAVGVTCQRATVVNLDANGSPLRSAILWSDQRRANNVPGVGGFYELGMRVIGVHPTVKHFQAEAEANWLYQHEPEIWARTHKYLLLSGYLNYQLTGEFVDSRANQVGYIPFNYRRQTWAKEHQWHWRALRGVKRSQLPELVSPGTVMGTVKANIARDFNLPLDLPVVACATDKACETLGSGCVDSTTACLSFGTAATVNVMGRRYQEVERLVPAYPAAISGRFLYEIQTPRGFWLVSWFRREFAKQETHEAETLGVDTEVLFDKFLQSTPPGAAGLIAQPSWAPGVRAPGPEARGALVGFNSEHTRAHIYRALIEGIVFSLREGLEKIVRKTGQNIQQVHVAGGGARSDEIVALTANILGLPVHRSSDSEVTSLGAAMCCAIATSVSADVNNIVAAMRQNESPVTPDPTTHATYDSLYREVYQPLYGRLRPLYRELLAQRSAHSDTSMKHE